MKPASRKKVLIIGMLNSIHLSNWLIRFRDEEIDFYLYPSRQYRYLDPQLKRLINENQAAKFILVRNLPSPSLRNYMDFLAETKWLRWLFPKLRVNALSNFISRNELDFIHCLEIQNAGYLMLEVDCELLVNPEVIVTNWGSDIYYFSRFEDHEIKIKNVLSLADRYSAECFRDYELASNLGFVGNNLPLIPNSFIHLPDVFVDLQTLSSSRRWVTIKGYGGQFGRVQLVVEAIEKLLSDGTDFFFFFYSVTPDVEAVISQLQIRYPSRVSYITVGRKISKEEMADWFAKSRIYIGCSISDGVSTSFLEALYHGCYPIQTNTSCASEWVIKGAVASVIHPSPEELWKELLKATQNDELVNQAQLANKQIANEYLNHSELMAKSRLFYDLN